MQTNGGTCYYNQAAPSTPQYEDALMLSLVRCNSLEHLLLHSFRLRVPAFGWRTEMMQIQEPLSWWMSQSAGVCHTRMSTNGQTYWTRVEVQVLVCWRPNTFVPSDMMFTSFSRDSSEKSNGWAENLLERGNQRGPVGANIRWPDSYRFKTQQW